ALRFAVDRSFVLHGVGVVVTGSVVSGQVALDETIRILPSGLQARVRSLHANGVAATRGVMGERCALNVTGPGVRKDAIARGDWLVDPAHGGLTARVDVELRLLSSETASLRSGTLAHVHHGAADLTGRVILLDVPVLSPGKAALGQLVLDRAVPCRHGDRLVLRDIAALRTIAGGRVLDSSPPVRRRSAPERLARLRVGRGADPALFLQGLLALPPWIVDVEAFAADWGLPAAELEEIARAADLLRISDKRYGLSRAAEGRLAKEAERTLSAFHAAHPALPGMPLTGLRLAFSAPPMPAPFRALIDHLSRADKVRIEGQTVRLLHHVPALGPEEARIWGRLSAMLNEAKFKAPRVRDSAAALGASEIAVRRSCKALARTGRLVEIVPDRFFLTEAVAQMASIAAALSGETRGAFTAAQFRDRIGTGRGLAIEVLEYFDRRGLTQRRGDLRRVVRDPAALFGSKNG
ncbi:MAG: SelB C-terminal domain-containing protein, partial [Acetobacteraceae bacterium]|nr:SelB C-terminal domain-containing protein [Acetobacteraceae bacterium]